MRRSHQPPPVTGKAADSPRKGLACTVAPRLEERRRSRRPTTALLTTDCEIVMFLLPALIRDVQRVSEAASALPDAPVVNEPVRRASRTRIAVSTGLMRAARVVAPA